MRDACRRRSLVTALAAAAMALAACSSPGRSLDMRAVLEGRSGAADGGDAAAETAGPDVDSGAADSVNNGSGSGAAAGPGATGAGRRAGGAASAATGAGTITRRGAAAATGPPLPVGIRYISGTDQLAATLGASGFSAPDTRGMAQALVLEINRQGGIAGRPLAPVFAPYDANDITGTAAQEQRACATFTEDSHVPLVLSGFFSSDVLQACLAKKGAVLIDENYGFFDPSVSPSSYFVPGYPDPVRGANALVDSLVASGFFGSQAKIGITRKDSPDRARVASAIGSALARHGMKVADEMRYTADHPEAASAGILRFRSEGISHVFMLDIGGIESQVLLTQAESQGFHPKYAFDTRNNPVYLATNAPPTQLAGAQGLGWNPSTDVGRGPGSEPGDAERRCVSIMRAAGVALRDSGNDRFAYAYCDVFFLLQAAAAKGGGVTPASLRAGVEALGAGYRPVGSFAARFGPGRHDGASAARPFAFDGGCSCFAYRSGLVPLP